MKVNEIFKSIQGEGPATGEAAIFIRLSKCNLKCPFCDTSFDSFKEMTIDEVMTAVMELKGPKGPEIVVLTGGEPTLQKKEVEGLIKVLHLHCFDVHIETNGTSDDDFLESVDMVACSPKEQAAYKVSKYATCLKYVITPEFNAREVITEDIRDKYAGRIYLQPESSQMEEMWKKCYELAIEDSRLRVGCQLHKLVGVV